MLVLAALSPLIAVFLLLVVFRWPATRAMPAAYVVAVTVAIALWGMTPRVVAAATLRGAMIAASLLWIILPALALLYTLRETGGLQVIRAGFIGLSPDPRVQALVVAWLFGSFMEGAAGFGTPAAIAGPLLVGLGFPPMAACALSLIIQSTPVSFGAAGTPILIGMGEALNVPQVLEPLSEAGVPYDAFIASIGAQAATVHAVAGLLVPFLVLAVLGRVFGESRSVTEALGIWRFALFAGIAFVLPYLAFAWLLGPEFPSLLGSLVALAVVVPAARRGFLLRRVAPWRFPPRERWDGRWSGTLTVDSGLPEGRDPETRISLLRAWSPYLFAAALLVATRIPALGLRSALEAVEIHWANILGTPLSQSIQPLYLPGTMLALAAIAAPRLHGQPTLPIARKAWGGAFKTLVGPALALYFAVGLVRVFIDSGLNGSGLESMPLYLAERLAAAVGGAWPFFAPWVGAMGAFVAGSNTVSDLMFALFQFGVAASAALPVVLILGLQAVGGAAGNMITVHNVVAAGATVGLVGEEGSLIRLTLVPMIIYLTVAGLVGFVLAQLATWQML